MPRYITNKELDNLIEHNCDDTVVGAAARELKAARQYIRETMEQLQELSDKLASDIKY